jgi:excisionase family DNA binding protein
MLKQDRQCDELLTVHEASRRLAVAPVTLRRWLRLTIIPSVHLGRSRRVRLGDIEALMRVGFPKTPAVNPSNTARSANSTAEKQNG